MERREQNSSHALPSPVIPFGDGQPSGVYNDWWSTKPPDLFSDNSIRQYNKGQRIRRETALATAALDAMDTNPEIDLSPHPRVTLKLDRHDYPTLDSNGTVRASFSDAKTRYIETKTYGPEDAPPVIWIPGTPSSNRGFLPPYSKAYRVIAADRPGYGGSTRDENRTIADGAAWVLAIAKAYDLKERFIVAGRSGGGPYALATAAFYPSEVAAVVVVSSFTPNESTYSTTTAQGNITADTLAIQDRRALWQRFKAEHAAGPTGVIDHSIRPDASPSDQRALEDRHLIGELALSHHIGGPIGRFDDIVAKTRPWGFSLEDVLIPTIVVHGEDDAFTSPENYWRFLRQLPRADGLLYSGVGHLGTSGEITQHALSIAANRYRDSCSLAT